MHYLRISQKHSRLAWADMFLQDVRHCWSCHVRSWFCTFNVHPQWYALQMICEKPENLKAKLTLCSSKVHLRSELCKIEMQDFKDRVRYQYFEVWWYALASKILEGVSNFDQGHVEVILLMQSSWSSSFSNLSNWTNTSVLQRMPIKCQDIKCSVMYVYQHAIVMTLITLCKDIVIYKTTSRTTSFEWKIENLPQLLLV